MEAFVSEFEERHDGWNEVVFVSVFHPSFRCTMELVPIGSGTNVSDRDCDVMCAEVCWDIGASPSLLSLYTLPTHRIQGP